MKALPCQLGAVLVALTVLAAVEAGEPDAPVVPHGVVELFNGRDLSGWGTWLVDAQGRDPRGVYSVRDGVLRISGDGFGYLSTDRAYKDYRLVVELKWGTRNFRTRKGMARDSGIFLHAVGPDGGSYDCGWGSERSNTGPDISSGAYKAAIECQIFLQCEGSEIFFRKIELHLLGRSVSVDGPLRIVALGDSITNFLVKDYAQAMRGVAAEKGVELIDVYRAFQKNPSSLDYFPDGLHPDARGHRMIADLLVDRLASRSTGPARQAGPSKPDEPHRER